jgi:hypothetical protein
VVVGILQIEKWEQENEREKIQAAMHNIVGLSYQQLAPEQRATACMLLTVNADSQMYIPFNSHPTLITLLKQLGVNTAVVVYTTEIDLFEPPKFIGVVSGEMQRIFLTHMTKYDRPLILILDTATDSVGNDMLVILFQILENDRPDVLFYKLKQMGVETLNKVGNALRRGHYQKLHSGKPKISQRRKGSQTQPLVYCSK